MFRKDMNSHMNKGNREATAVKCRKATKDHQNKGALWRVRGWKQRWQHRTRQVQYSDTGAVGMGSARGTKGTQCHNEPTTQAWRLIHVAALPPPHTPDTSQIPETPPGCAVLETPPRNGMDQNSCWDTRGHAGQGRCSLSPP